MNNSVISLFLILFSLLISCEKNGGSPGIKTGLVGNVKYGSGDCMPIIDEASREYTPYNGELYFVVKSKLSYPLPELFEDILANSIRETIVNGVISVELPADTFLVMPPNIYMYSDEKTIIIEEGNVLVKNFKFWECTSY